jgi:hypothetical protein
MWLVTTPKMIYSASVISLISADVIKKVIHMSLNSLEFTFNYMISNNTNISIKKYQDDLEILDIHLKLKLIDIWLNKININKLDESQTIIYQSISDSCHKIADTIQIINDNIKYHNTKWFNSWRNIYLDDEIKILEKNVKILDERLLLLNLITF